MDKELVKRSRWAVEQIECLRGNASELAEEFCGRYCRYPAELSQEECDFVCASCPMALLVALLE